MEFFISLLLINNLCIMLASCIHKITNISMHPKKFIFNIIIDVIIIVVLCFFLVVLISAVYLSSNK